MILLIYDPYNCNWSRECAKSDGFMHECFFVLSNGRCILHSKNQFTGTEEGGSKSGKHTTACNYQKRAKLKPAKPCVCVCKWVFARGIGVNTLLNNYDYTIYFIIIENICTISLFLILLSAIVRMRKWDGFILIS